MPHEQTRKIIRVGNSLAVTMPKAWVRYFNLTDKDKVTVVSNGKVIIEPQNVPNQGRRIHAAARR